MLLDQGLLDRLEARLRAQDALIVDTWAPGLSDAQIDTILQPVGINLPEEARRWWRWHNGTLPGAPPRAKEISPYRNLLALEAVADFYESGRHEMLYLWGIDGLLTPVTDMPLVYFHCDGPDAPVPVYTQIDHTEQPRRVLSSIGELVLAWIDLMDRGIWATNADGTWAIDHDRALPPDVMRLGIY